MHGDADRDPGAHAGHGISVPLKTFVLFVFFVVINQKLLSSA
jgi:hypothetical protein